MQTVQDETMPVPGFEHHTFMCSSCHDVEQRLTFSKPREQPNPEAVPVDAVPLDAVPVHAMAVHAAPVDAAPLHIAPSISPTAGAHEHASAGGGMLRRVLSKLRGG